MTTPSRPHPPSRSPPTHRWPRRRRTTRRSPPRRRTPTPGAVRANPYGQGQFGQNPYGQDPSGQGQYPQQPSDPSAYGATPYQQPYGSTAYGQPPYALPPAPYGAPPAKNTSAIVLTVVSGLALIACCNLLAIPSLILGIVGISKGPDDPQGAARVTRAGWITFGVTTALVVIGWVIFFALLAAGTFDGSASYDYQQV